MPCEQASRSIPTHRMSASQNVHQLALRALMEPDPEGKAALAREARRAWARGAACAAPTPPPGPLAAPGRPERPRLVDPAALPSRNLGDPQGLAALVHALAHIELNAVDLALDAVYRFRGLPPGFYADWLRVAEEEAGHFALLRTHLRELGADYGDFDAHDGLWRMACRTAHDPLVRMALVPRVLEARGLDVSPGMIARLQGVGAHRAADILGIIYRDEIGHVAIGTRWFRHLCAERDLEPRNTFAALVSEYLSGGVRGPFDLEGRRRAGFTEQELSDLGALGRAG